MRDRVSEGWERANVKIDQVFDVAKRSAVENLDQVSTFLNIVEVDLLSTEVGLAKDYYQISISSKDLTYIRLLKLSNRLSLLSIANTGYMAYKGDIAWEQFVYQSLMITASFPLTPQVSAAITAFDLITGSYKNAGEYLFDQYYKWESYWKEVSHNPRIIYY